MTKKILIVGGGVIGCAMLEHLSSYEGISCILIEKNQSLVTGASSGNSGILHTGFDAPSIGLEKDLMIRGRSLLLHLLSQFPKDSIKFDECGALMIAKTEKEFEYITEVHNKMKASNIQTELWNTHRIFNYEPNLDKSVNVIQGLWIPGESVIDPFAFPILLSQLAKKKGGSVLLGMELISAKKVNSDKTKENCWQCELRNTNNNNIITETADVVINCAGNYGDLVDSMIIGRESNFHDTPRKGQFIVYEKAAEHLLSSIILPIPTSRTKGVLVCKTAFGNIIVGPTAEDQKDRENRDTIPETLLQLQKKGEEILPALKNYKIIGSYAGLRPATEHRDYQISIDKNNNYICIGGIRSTGLTASMGIAEYIGNQLSNIIPNIKYKPTNYSSLDYKDLFGEYQHSSNRLEYKFTNSNSSEIVSHRLPITSFNEMNHKIKSNL